MEQSQEQNTNEEFSDEELEGLSEQELEALGKSPDDKDPGEGDPKPDEDAEAVAAAAAEAAEKATADAAAEAAAAVDLEIKPAAAEVDPAIAAAAAAATAAVDAAKQKETDDAAAKVAADEAAAKAAEPTSADRVNAIQTELESLGEQLEDGDINFKEYNKQNNSLVEEREDLKADIRDQTRTEAEEKQSDEDAWNTASSTFLAEDGNSAIKDNLIVQDAYMSIYANVAAQPEMQGKDYLSIMQEAKKSMAEAGFTFVEAKKEPEKKPASRKPEGDLPVTLGSIPAAASNTGDEFATIDSLEGIEYEEAVAALSPEAAARYAEA